MEAVAKIKDVAKRNIDVIVKNALPFISITVDNMYEGALKYDKDGALLTLKEDNGYHGFGVRSIELFAKKYDGTCTTKSDHSLFPLLVLLPIPGAPA